MSEPTPPSAIATATRAGSAANSASGTKPGPLALVIDDEAAIRQFVSLILQGNGIDTMEFADGAAFRKARPARMPELVFLDINLEVQDAVRSVEALAQSGFGGAVQLMSNRGSAVLDTVRQAGEQHKLRILPVLKKPFETSAIQQVIADLNLGLPRSATNKVALAEAMKNDWIEFWYQPKIDLRRKQLAGAEAFVRVRHPLHGILMPASFMPDADDASLQALAERALVGALKSGLNLSRLGVNLRMSINVGISQLVKLSIEDIVRSYRPRTDNWPGLIIDVTEEQIVSEIGLAQELSTKFQQQNVRLAIDDFGKGYSTLMKLKELPFAEMKLDRAFVAGCGTDKVHAPICKTVIELAHSFGSVAVGIGLEKAADAMALVSMGCDLGQGFLYGQPMPEDRFIALLKQRVTVQPGAAPVSTRAPTPAA